MVDYYVEAEDSLGTVSRSPILHVYVGSMTGGGGASATVSWEPVAPTIHDTILVAVKSAKGGWLHWGVNQWELPNAAYRPAGSSVWSDNKAIETPMTAPDSLGIMRLKIGPFNNAVQIPSKIAMVVHYSDGTWDNNGGKDYFIPLTATSAEDAIAPIEFGLEPNYPNPFNPTTNVEYRNSKWQHVRLSVHDLLGREIAVLMDETKPAGRYHTVWNAEARPSGVYYLRFATEGKTIVQKMMLLK